jgi:hypothetical protein
LELEELRRAKGLNSSLKDQKEKLQKELIKLQAEFEELKFDSEQKSRELDHFSNLNNELKSFEKECLELKFDNEQLLREKDRTELVNGSLRKELDYYKQNKNELDKSQETSLIELRAENKKLGEKVSAGDNAIFDFQTEHKILTDKMHRRTKEIEKYKNEVFEMKLKIESHDYDNDSPQKIQELTSIVKNLTDENHRLIRTAETQELDTEKLLTNLASRRDASDQTTTTVISQIRTELRKTEDLKTQIQEENL